MRKDQDFEGPCQVSERNNNNLKYRVKWTSLLLYCEVVMMSEILHI